MARRPRVAIIGNSNSLLRHGYTAHLDPERFDVRRFALGACPNAMLLYALTMPGWDIAFDWIVIETSPTDQMFEQLGLYGAAQRRAALALFLDEVARRQPGARVLALVLPFQATLAGDAPSLTPELLDGLATAARPVVVLDIAAVFWRHAAGTPLADVFMADRMHPSPPAQIVVGRLLACVLSGLEQPVDWVAPGPGHGHGAAGRAGRRDARAAADQPDRHRAGPSSRPRRNRTVDGRAPGADRGGRHQPQRDKLRAAAERRDDARGRSAVPARPGARDGGQPDPGPGRRDRHGACDRTAARGGRGRRADLGKRSGKAATGLEFWGVLVADAEALDAVRARQTVPADALAEPAVAAEAARLMAEFARWHAAFSQRWLLIGSPWLLGWAEQFRADLLAARTRPEVLAAALTLFRRFGDPAACAILTT